MLEGSGKNKHDLCGIKDEQAMATLWELSARTGFTLLVCIRGWSERCKFGIIASFLLGL